jgi:hypothetical protein
MKAHAFANLMVINPSGSDSGGQMPQYQALGFVWLDGPVTVPDNGVPTSYPNGTFVNAAASGAINHTDSLVDIQSEVSQAFLAYVAAHFGVILDQIVITYLS